MLASRGDRHRRGQGLHRDALPTQSRRLRRIFVAVCGASQVRSGSSMLYSRRASARFPARKCSCATWIMVNSHAGMLPIAPRASHRGRTASAPPKIPARRRAHRQQPRDAVAAGSLLLHVADRRNRIEQLHGVSGPDPDRAVPARSEKRSAGRIRAPRP